MLTIAGGRHRFCDGINRRNFLKLGGLALGGLSLPQLMAAEAAHGQSSRKAIIMVFLPGGPSHQDIVDLKPDAPDGIRGEFKPISTNVPGIQICEHLPRLAAMMDKLVIIRSMAGAQPHHDPYQCFTGRTKLGQPVGGWPSLGAVTSKLQGPTDPAVPPFVGLSPRMDHMPWSDPGGPGYLGLAHAPFQPQRSGHASISLRDITLDQMHDRKSLLVGMDSIRRDLDEWPAVEGMGVFKRRAFELITSSRVAEALDVSRENPQARARYGRGDAKNRGDGGAPNNEYFLVARRLVEAGVRCVTLAFGRWDTHSRNFPVLREDLPRLDQGLSALVQDLHDRGLEKDVSVVVWGEFGRTPRISSTGGRDHWSPVSCAMLACGGMRTGQVIGSTDKIAGAVADRPVHFQEVFATLYQQMGIDPATTILHDTMSRPQHLVDSAYSPMRELI